MDFEFEDTPYMCLPVAVPPPLPKSDTLTGVLERIIFFNEENHYTIAELRPDEPATVKNTPAPTAGDVASVERRVTIAGPLPGVQCGETLRLSGVWTRHPQHGAQFKVEAFKSELPASVYGIRKYLGSGLVPGIGKVYANKIVDTFGQDTFRVISDESARLREVPGIGKTRALAIKEAWEAQRTLRELHIFLQTYGVTASQCTRLVNKYGGEARQILLKEPYRVAREIDGIGFKTADQIALNLGYANDAPPRLDAGIIYGLETLQDDGHTAFPSDELVQHCAELLQTDHSRLAARIDTLVESKQLVRHGPDQPKLPTLDPRPSTPALIQLPINNRSERKIADVVARLSKVGSGLPPIKIAAALAWAQDKARVEFDAQQQAAVHNALAHKFSLLTGGPGTGKTTCLRALVDILRAKKVRVHLAAPTGRAAQRLAETTGGFASTIHRLLKFDHGKGGFTVNESHPLATDFLVVDEASMLDARLAAALLQAVPARAHLLLVGDTDQLPSVGAGNVLKDLITTGKIPVTRLNIIHRQKEQSQIVTTAHTINSGDGSLPPAVTDLAKIQPWRDLTFVIADSAEDCLAKIIALCTRFIPDHFEWAHPIDDVQILAPMHKGVCGVANLNVQLQAALNPHGQSIRTISGEFRAGDKLIQLRNNYDKNLFNGDIGSVIALDGVKGTVVADFDGEKHTFERSDFGDLAPAYAISIHKSQGSEYPVVIIPLLKAHFMMLQRNLIYTAITRGRKKVFLVGEAAAYGMAVRNNESRRRCTHLCQKILATPG